MLEVDSYSWTDPDGVETVFNGANGIIVGKDRDGFFMPPFDFLSNEIPGQPGARLRAVKTLTRQPALLVLIKGTSPDDCRAKLRNFCHLFNPQRGDGTLKVTAPDAVQRKLTCRYKQGLGMEQTRESNGIFVQKAVIVFWAGDPYWYSTSDSTVLYTASGTPATFFPFFPLTLVDSTIFADDTVANSGEEVWPRWEITGPGSNITIRNLTTGKLLSLSTTLLDSETISIDTRPGAKTVTKNDGSNLYGDLTSGSSLWPLITGDNSIRVGIDGPDANTQAQLTFTERFLSV